MPAKGLVRCRRVGTGLVCIRADVLERFDEAGEIPFFLPESIRMASVKEMQIKTGEDMYFCEQAERLGFDIWADLSVRAKHYKKVAISWPDGATDSSLSVEDWSVSAKDWAYNES
jgi:hypothetical protein